MSKTFIAPTLTRDATAASKYHAVIWDKPGQKPQVIWAPKGVEDLLLSQAVAWMGLDDNRVMTYTLRERTVWCKYDRRTLTIWDRVGKAWDATKEIHPTVITQMLQVRQQHLSR